MYGVVLTQKNCAAQKKYRAVVYTSEFRAQSSTSVLRSSCNHCTLQLR